jgi:hypothetical protein
MDRPYSVNGAEEEPVWLLVVRPEGRRLQERSRYR